MLPKHDRWPGALPRVAYLHRPVLRPGRDQRAARVERVDIAVVVRHRPAGNATRQVQAERGAVRRARRQARLAAPGERVHGVLLAERSRVEAAPGRGAERVPGAAAL